MLGKLDALADDCLYTLKVEIRAHCTCYLESLIEEDDYHSGDMPFEPDSLVSMLTQKILDMQRVISTSLPESDSMYLMAGLAQVLAHLQLAVVRGVSKLDLHGSYRLVRNSVALTQMWTLICGEHSSLLSSMTTYFELFALGPDVNLFPLTDM